MSGELTGFHHLTAVSAKIRENYRFYTHTMGMRLIKRSVNQDEVRAYHLFYSDAVGSPGNDLTFFDFHVRPERRGTRAVTRTGLRVKGEEAIEWWARRLRDEKLDIAAPVERNGRLTLDFEDAEGQRLSLVDDGGGGDAPVPWTESPVPAEYQIRGLGPIMMSVPELTRTEAMVVEVMRMRRIAEYPHPDNDKDTVYVFEMGGGGAHAELHVAVQPGLPVTGPGAGGVHHVAFRTPNEEEYHGWTERLSSYGLQHSGEIDRYYFRSLYVREPNGVLFEIATDGPGFLVDEPAETAGQKVALPPFLEPRRAEIEAGLQPIE